MWHDYEPRLSAAERRRKAEAAARRLAKKGRVLAPISVTGRQIATTFWGKAWCDHLATYSDYESRLERGRTYARSGSIIDLQVSAGRVSALVQGNALYEVEIKFKRLAARRWQAFGKQAAGRVSNLLDLLQGKLPIEVLNAATRVEGGLFPVPADISFTCSCPDWARMCKHVAAVLYGVGVRLDREPGLFFLLRGVDAEELVAAAASAATRAPRTRRAPAAKRLDEDALSDIFGVDIETTQPPPTMRAKTARRKASSPSPAHAIKAESSPGRVSTRKVIEEQSSPAKRTARAPSKPPRTTVKVLVRRADEAPAPPAKTTTRRKSK